MNPHIHDLIHDYPDVDIPGLPLDVLTQIAHLYLAGERAKLWADRKPSYTPEAGREALATVTTMAVKQDRRRRERDLERIATNRAKVDAAVSNSISRIVRENADKLLSDWLPALLDSTFALPDGTRVTWSDATVAQHEERAAWLEKTASANVETAGMHRRAVSDIRATGSLTLGEATREKKSA